jgi:hypothetical protein
MGTAHQVQVVLLQELGDAVWAECVGDAAIVLTPALDVLVGVSPQQITEQPGVWDIGGPSNTLDLLQGLELW